MTAQLDDVGLSDLGALPGTRTRHLHAVPTNHLPTTDRPRPSPAVRLLAALAATAVGTCTLVIALLHFRPADRRVDPLSAPISNYALTSDGWLFDLAVAVLALGLAALLCALVLGGWVAARSMAFAVLTVSCLGLITVVIFPDRTSHGALTTSAWIHWSAAMAAFACLLAAPGLLGHRRGLGAGCSLLPNLARWLSLTAAGWFAVLFAGSVLQFATSLPVWHVGGAVERALAVTEMLIAVVLATWVGRGCPCRSADLDAAPATTLATALAAAPTTRSGARRTTHPRRQRP